MRALLLALALTMPLVPTVAADGCTRASTAYACSFEEPDACGGFTSAGAGVGGVAGVAFAGFDECDRDHVVLTASVSVVFVDLVWDDRGCMVLAAPGLGAALPCVAGAAPPNPGWGDAIPPLP